MHPFYRDCRARGAALPSGAGVVTCRRAETFTMIEEIQRTPEIVAELLKQLYGERARPQALRHATLANRHGDVDRADLYLRAAEILDDGEQD